MVFSESSVRPDNIHALRDRSISTCGEFTVIHPVKIRVNSTLSKGHHDVLVIGTNLRCSQKGGPLYLVSLTASQVSSWNGVYETCTYKAKTETVGIDICTYSCNCAEDLCPQVQLMFYQKPEHYGTWSLCEIGQCVCS